MGKAGGVKPLQVGSSLAEAESGPHSFQPSFAAPVPMRQDHPLIAASLFNQAQGKPTSIGHRTDRQDAECERSPSRLGFQVLRKVVGLVEVKLQKLAL